MNNCCLAAARKKKTSAQSNMFLKSSFPSSSQVEFSSNCCYHASHLVGHMFLGDPDTIPASGFRHIKYFSINCCLMEMLPLEAFRWEHKHVTGNVQMEAFGSTEIMVGVG